MAIEGKDWALLAALLRKAETEGLARREEDELRSILGQQSPRARVMPFDELTRFGAFLYGLNDIQQQNRLYLAGRRA